MKPRAEENNPSVYEKKPRGKKKTCLSFCDLPLPSFATILNLLQKSSPFSPRPGKRVSSELPRMMGFRGIATPSENLTFIGLPSRGAGEFVGRIKAGVMGVIEECKGCGAEGAGDGDIEYGGRD
jgi:hypothetical protein